MTSFGDELLAGGQKQTAYDQYEKTREQCVRFHPVRRRLFNVTHPASSAAPDAPLTDVVFNLDLDVQMPGDTDVVLLGLSPYLDGEPFSLESQKSVRLSPGAHEVTIEVYLERNLRGTSLEAVRMDLRNTVVLPRALAGQEDVSGSLLVHIHDAVGSGPLANRLTTTNELKPLSVQRATAKPQEPKVVVQGAKPPPIVKAGMRLTDVNLPAHKPKLPPALNRAGVTLWGLYQICVDDEGAVHRVTTMKSALTPVVDVYFKSAIRTWRYRPYEVDGKLVPFCSPVRLQVSAAG